MKLGIFTVFLLWEFPLVCGEVRQATAALDPSLSDRKFTTNVLFERDGLSELRCAALCLQTDQCATFTCTQTEGRLCQCRGYQGRKTPSDPHEDSPETTAYVFLVEETPAETTPAAPDTTTEEATTAKADLLNVTCSSDADCNVNELNTNCRSGRCMCIHGFYYSVGAKVCQQDCPASDLQTTYLRFEECSLSSHNEEWHNGWTLDACKSQCDSDNQCLHYEYGSGGSDCTISYDNTRLLTAADGWKDPDTTPGWSHYQRNCA